MVVIFSTDFDQSTNDVIDWLSLSNEEFFRPNEFIRRLKPSIEINDGNFILELTVNNYSIKFTSNTFYWYRRGKFNADNKSVLKNDSLSIFNYKNDQALENFLDDYLSSHGVGKYSDNALNKLSVLREASISGLKIPDSIISDKSEDYRRFLSTKEGITKRITNADLSISGNYLVFFTQSIKKENLDSLNEDCIPFLVQQKIEKTADIRVFYWLGKCHSSLVHSQNHIETKIDMRHATNSGMQSRWEPFDLPEDLETKIYNLMKRLGLKTGSLDFALTPEHDFVFFEVNPVGQFGYLSEVCGYNLEKMIANDLATGRAKAFNYGE